MEKDFGSSFHLQYSDLQLALLNFSCPRLDIGQQKAVPAYMTPRPIGPPMNGNCPFLGFSGLPESKVSRPTEPWNWFYSLPQYHQGFAPVLTSVPNEKLAPRTIENLGGNKYPNAGAAPVQKRFLVFDQSGDQTTLLYSSANGTPVQHLAPWNPKPPTPYSLIKEEPETKRNETSPFGHFFGDEYLDENNRDDVESEMHEDTEELNALLYSDDDDGYSEDDEETSTGHSPSTMTNHEDHDLPGWFDERGEDVASTGGPAKRQKLVDGGYVAPSLVDTATSAKAYTCSDLEDDAESSCVKGNDQISGAQGSPCEKKRLRKDKIRETISILQAVIPGGKGKDWTDVIDEAIRYLKSLKAKAKSCRT